MEGALVGAIVGFAGGGAVAFVNAMLTRAAYKKSPASVQKIFPLRQLINLAYLVALYFLGPLLPWGVTPLLIGGALGLTIPSIFLALRLSKSVAGDKTEKDRVEEAKNRNG